MNKEKIIFTFIIALAVAITMRGLEKTQVLGKDPHLFLEICVVYTIVDMVQLFIHGLYKLAEYIN